jgi:hypothetical protein
VGTYPIIVGNAQGTGLGNYAITFVNGSLTVTRAHLTITANDQTKVYGQFLTFTRSDVTIAGLLFPSDRVGRIGLTSAGARARAPVGAYPILVSNAQGTGLGNYIITYVNGTLTVTAAELPSAAGPSSNSHGPKVTDARTKSTTDRSIRRSQVATVTPTRAAATATGTGAAITGSSHTSIPSDRVGNFRGNAIITTISGPRTVNPAAPISVANNQSITAPKLFVTKPVSHATTQAATAFFVGRRRHPRGAAPRKLVQTHP